VARQFARADRQLLLQRQINGYLLHETADPRASLERLSNAIDDETWKAEIGARYGLTFSRVSTSCRAKAGAETRPGASQHR